MTVYDFISQNLLAAYGAAVGTLALTLNFMRYRHAVSSMKARLKLEVIVRASEDAFEAEMNPKEEKEPWNGGNRQSLITHEVKVRNPGGVSVHIQEVWVHTQNGRVDAKMPYAGNQRNIYGSVSERGNVEIAPRSSHSFSVFSNKEGGYLKIRSAHAIDETGKHWRSSRIKSPAQ